MHAGVLINDCARSVRDAEKRDWFEISRDTYKFSFTLLYPYRQTDRQTDKQNSLFKCHVSILQKHSTHLKTSW